MRCVLGCIWVCVHEGWKLSTGEVIEELATLGGMVLVYLLLVCWGSKVGRAHFRESVLSYFYVGSRNYF